jgi:LacI family transcriptional regulator
MRMIIKVDGRAHAQRQVGVIVPAALEFGPQIIRGVGSWCNEHPEARMVIISEYGFSPNLIWPKQPVDCLVVLHSDRAEVESLRTHCPHIVLTSNKAPMPGFARVINDEHAIGVMGAEYLMGMGYHSMVFLHSGILNFSHERLAGFVEAVTSTGRDCHVLHGNGMEQLREQLPRLEGLADPIAVMAASDLHARWLIECWEEPESLIPSKLVVLGVDDDSLQSALSRVPISSVALSGERIGYEAAALGMRLAAGEAVPPAPLLIPPKRVVRRRSTDAMAIRDPAALKTLRIIKENLADLVDVGDLIRRVGIPRRTLEPKFNKATGKTLASALAEARITRARDLLATTDLSIKEISFLIGFSEPRMLTLVFKRITGELPSDYRQRILAGTGKL